MTASKKHHYIPRFYLTGFTDSNNQYYVFDKQTKKIWLTTPENSFAENHRNTGIVVDQNTSEIHKYDMPEEMLAHFDSRSAKAVYDIRNSTIDDDMLTVERLYALRFFIISTFWRTPANDHIRKDIINSHSFEDLGFGFFNKGKRLADVEKTMMDIDLWHKMYPTLLPMVSFSERYKRNNSGDFKLYYRSGLAHVVTDNPIILQEFKDFSSLNEELIFPISSKVFIIATSRYKPRHLPPAFNLKMDTLLFDNAHRYVACSNKDYLLLLANHVGSFMAEPGFNFMLKDDIFGYFY